MSKKKTFLNEMDVEKGIEDGIFVNAGTQIRDVASGHIVKVIKKKETGDNAIPSTFIQVHHNHVYQADLKPIIDAIALNRESNIYEALEEKYNLTLDYFDSYNTYGTNIEMVHQTCLETSVSFENKIRHEVEAFDIENMEKKDLVRFGGSLDAYVKVLFSYIISTYILHREKFSNDKVINNKILAYEKNVRSLYEQLLAKSEPKKDEDGKIVETFSIDHSLYSMYMFDDDYDIAELDDIVRHDSRFSSALQVVGFFKRHLKDGLFNNNNSGMYRTGNFEVKIHVSTDQISFKSKRTRLMAKLYNILEDIVKLKAIRSEIVKLKDITDTDVLTQVTEISANK